MDANLERIMEHEKRLSVKLADEGEAVRKEVEYFIRAESARANARKDEARQESLKRQEGLIDRERAGQEAMTRELHDRFSSLARDGDMTGLIRETVLQLLFRGGGGM